MLTEPQLVRAKAACVRVKDGDTYVMAIDFACEGHFELSPRYVVRLADFSTPEKNTPEGVASSKWVSEAFAYGVVTVQPRGHDKYGRLLAWVWIDGDALGPKMVALGLAHEGRGTG